MPPGRYFMARRMWREERDRISELPDRILVVHILSRLPTLEAVQTCVLSKRWVHVWTHITNLHFDLLRYQRRLKGHVIIQDHDLGRFQNFVSMVLCRLTTLSLENFSLSTTGSIENFALSTGAVVDRSVLNTWCPALANRGLQNLTISYDRFVGETFIFSSSIFSCHSLVQLSLELHCGATVPNFVHLPNLKTLELSRIHFTPENYGNSQEIILSFPVLKKFKFYDIFWSDVQSVSFEVPLLEIVEIKEYDSSELCTINLCTTRLTYFSFDGHPSHHYNILSKPSSNVNASTRIIFSKLDGSAEERKQWGIQACILLKQLNINHVKHLELTSTEVFSFSKDSFAGLPTFNMLCNLKLSRVSGEMLIELLLKSPYLTSLTIQMEHLKSSYRSESKVEHCEHDHAEKLLEFRIVPDCIRNTLKTFKMENFSGHQCQISLAKYIMENAEHLELLSFSPSRPLWNYPKLSKMDQIKEKVFSFKRGLNLTIIDFSGLF